LRAGDDRLLPGDRSQFTDDGIEHLGVLGRLPRAHVENDLAQLGHLVRVHEPELLRQLAPDHVVVMVAQPRWRRRRGVRWLIGRSGSATLLALLPLLTLVAF